MKKKYGMSARLLSVLLVLALTLSVSIVPASAAGDNLLIAPASTATAEGAFANTSGDGGADQISLSAERTFKVSIPVNMTGEEAAQAAQSVTWSLLPDTSKEYLDPEQFPNQTEGGALADWLCQDGATPFFTDITTAAETVDGQVYLTVTFANTCYFTEVLADGTLLKDLSVPHSNGGSYMDVCGYFNLTVQLDGEALGAAALKIAPYDQFHTMAEVYEKIDEIVAYAAENTDLYVQKASMGMSQGDNGLESLDMPYLILAKDQAAVKNWLVITEEAETDPTGLLAKLESGALGDYQVPILYSNVHANETAATDGILSFTWMLLEAAAGDGNIDYDKLTGFTAEGEAQLAEELGPEGEAGSVAVPDLVKDTATYLGYLRLGNTITSVWGDYVYESDYSGPVDLEKYYTVETQTVNVDELLEDVFFLIVPEENVEGRTYLTRTSSGGFDLNRDNSFQTQAETQNMTQLISTWNPVSFAEFHGRVETFQCEPCDPPHEPNFEYDLLSEHLLAGGEALGIAAVASNDAHNSYVIPQRDYLSYTGEINEDGSYQTQWYDPWDDMSTSYTPQFAMLHGTVAYTVEVPAYDDAMASALAYGQLGQSAYIAANKESYLTNQVKIYERGVTNFNSDAYELVGQWLTDQYDVEGAEADLFRPEYDGEGQNGNFYPECYIIPLDGENQSNLQAANDMMEWLARNDVKILLSEKEFTYDGVTYPAGTMVVTMYQAKRSVANGVLYNGTVITEWPVLYSEGITAFNHTRGFDMITCAEPAAYETIRAACGAFMDYEDCLDYLDKITSYFTGVTNGKVIIGNDSEDSTAAVNTLLQAGKEVGFIISGENKGSFICSYADWQSVSAKYIISGTGVAAADAPLSLSITKAPVVYICGKSADNTSGFVKSTLVSGSYEYNYDRQAMELLGFQTTDDPAEADLIIGAAKLSGAALEAVKNGTPYIGYGRRVDLSPLFAEGELVRQTAGPSAMDALAYVTYPEESLITASYVAEGDNILYGYGAGYFASIPEGAKVLVKLDGSKDLLEGFLPSTGAHCEDFLNDSIQAFSYRGKGADDSDLNIVLFANTLTNKVHQRDEFNFISNTAFANLLGGIFTGTVDTEEEAADLAAVLYTDVEADDWFAAEVGMAAAAGLMNGSSDTTFNPVGITTRSQIVTTLWRLSGEPVVNYAMDFSDVAGGLWYSEAVRWAASEGIVEGYNGAFDPNGDLTREQAVTILYRYFEKQGADVSAAMGTAGYSDVDQVSGYAADGMRWAVSAGLIKGSDGKLNPLGTATRAELATIMLRAQELLKK